MTPSMDEALSDRRRPRIHVPAVTIAARLHQAVHLLLWQVEGRSNLSLDGEQVAVSVGESIWVPAGVSHGFTVQENSVLLPLFFEASSTATTVLEPTVITVDRDLRTLMLAYVQSQNSIIKPRADLARQILALIERQPTPPSALPLPTTPSARTIAEALRFNPGDHRTLSELAAGVHTSTRTIERAFRTETGMTLRRWRIRNRLEAAIRLLRRGLSVQAVAQRVGYTSASAFHRVFRTEFGMSPQEYVGRFPADG